MKRKRERISLEQESPLSGFLLNMDGEFVQFCSLLCTVSLHSLYNSVALLLFQFPFSSLDELVFSSTSVHMKYTSNQTLP